jgi:hypothetical protein
MIHKKFKKPRIYKRHGAWCVDVNGNVVSAQTIKGAWRLASLNERTRYDSKWWLNIMTREAA